MPKTLRRFSNPASNSVLAGTDIFVRKDFAQFFDIKHTLVAPGHIQLLRFTPKGDRPLFNQCFTVMNVYLPSGSGSDFSHFRDSCLTKLCEVESDRYVFAAGDWNMTEHESDSAGGDHKATAQSTRQLFTKFLSIHDLTEVYQPMHTFFRATSSSRLDRIYVSHSPAEKCLMAPSVSIPSHPHMPGMAKDKGPLITSPSSSLFTQQRLQSTLASRFQSSLPTMENSLTVCALHSLGSLTCPIPSKHGYSSRL